ncbi:MAG: DUF1549 domain-containing protein [Gemmataceae bacterium]|nr:DUF1549 domain-containing protein [Gemmataceae bacterium]
MREVVRYLCLTTVGLACASTTLAEDLSKDIQSLLQSRCLECHGQDKQRGGLRLDRKDLALKGGDAPEKAIVPGKPGESLLLQMVTAGRDGKIMPLKGPRLTAEEVEKVKSWIAAGAPWPQTKAAAVKHAHWAFNYPSRPRFPQVKNQAWVKNAIDYFIAAKLEQAGLAPLPQADKSALLRRVSLDLTGLPPTPAEYDAFLIDLSPLAYETQVDRLLASPRFGERWARHWLDLGRYADSRGFGSDPLRLNAWPWRDWVIDAFNRNLPFDQFTIEQLAGDLLPSPTEDQILATGFHRNTMTNTEGGTDDEEFRVAAIKDRADSTAQIWMGLTLGCAKCHSHKFDPISQKEYYSFYALFNQSMDSDKGDEFPTRAIAPGWQRAALEQASEKIAAVKQQIAQADVREDLAKWETGLGLNLPPRPLETAPSAEPGGLLVSLPSGTDWSALEATTKSGAKLASQPASIKIIPGAMGKPLPFPTGHIVRVDLPGKGKILSLAEVQVFSQGKNIAPLGKAGQSSADFDGSANLAIDGNTNGDYFVAKSTTHSKTENNPWWEVALKEPLPIEKIVLWNRTDGGIYTRLQGFKLSILDSKRNVIWSREGIAAPQVSQDFAPVSAVEIRDRAMYSKDGSAVFLFPAGVKDLKPPFRLRIFDEKNKELDAAAFHFRLAAGNWAAFQPLPPEVQKILLLKPAARSQEQVAKLASHLQTNSPRLQPLREELGRLEKARPTITPVAIMAELAKDKARKTQVLVKGNFLTPGVEVAPGLPALFNSGPFTQAPNRLDLAHWIVSKDNPLTARVEVNRIWSLIFGRGLVETEEDFGTMGQPPSHAELLDWLALEFMHSGWDRKRFLQLVMTSSVYRQSARTTLLALEKDSRNILLSRSPRPRLDAEQVRDQALALGGLLSSKMFGPSVYPPQPPNLWQAAFNGERSWATSQGEDKVRRGLYTFWRRTVPYPSMQTFDAPSREFCTIRRVNTNTPLQAFVTLNDPVFVEAAQGMALRVLTEGGATPEAQMAYAWKLATGAALGRLQEQYLRELLEFSRVKFQDTAAAQKMAPLPAGLPALQQAELAAWTVVCNILLNLDQVLTRS